jgi:uncharacterized repeat protein (TIGR03837 family)
MLWDIFCKVIDNHGDVGVCWRLSAELARRGHPVRLRIDDPSALRWMAPGGQDGLTVSAWDDAAPPGDAVVEAFGCELPASFQAALRARTGATGRQPAWINLEYLTGERFAQRNHGLPSPVLSGPAAGLTKRFFYPGFAPGTGGLIRENGLMQRQAMFDRHAWLRTHGIDAGGKQLVSLFCYEPAALGSLLRQLADTDSHLLVTPGRAAQAVGALNPAPDCPTISWLPLLDQIDYDHLLWSCDLNFVRGEDSLVRALWAGKPFVWQLYPQDDGAHGPKLGAFLDGLEAPASLRDFHRAWNGLARDLPPAEPAAWQSATLAARDRLLQQEDLVTQLTRFAETERVRVSFPRA